EVRESDIADDVQYRRLLAAADERLPDCRRRDRDKGVSVAAGCGIGAAESDHQLHGVWRQEALVGCEHRTGAGADRLADSAGRRLLQPGVQGPECVGAAGWHRRAADSRWRRLWLERCQRGTEPAGG